MLRRHVRRMLRHATSQRPHASAGETEGVVTGGSPSLVSRPVARGGAPGGCWHRRCREQLNPAWQSAAAVVANTGEQQRVGAAGPLVQLWRPQHEEHEDHGGHLVPGGRARA
jgi:hypothetical protein